MEKGGGRGKGSGREGQCRGRESQGAWRSRLEGQPGWRVLALLESVNVWCFAENRAGKEAGLGMGGHSH